MEKMMAKKTDSSRWDGVQQTIESAWERRTVLTTAEIEGSTQTAVEEVIAGLERGELRVASPGRGGQWQVHQWLKKAVLLYFRVNDMQMMEDRKSTRLNSSH